MTNPPQFRCWQPSDASLKNLDPIRARDLLIQCFLEAQRDAIRLAKQRLAVPDSDATMRASAEGSLRAAFRRTGGNFDVPTRESLRLAAEDLGKTSVALGAPPEVVDHHQRLIGDIISRLPA